MPGHDIIVIGASAGGVETLSQLVSGLPADLPAAVFVVLHTQPNGHSVLPRILSRSGPLPAAHPRDGEAIGLGQIYVAPPDHHLLIKDGRIRLTRGPQENSHRPAIDPLFRTAAASYGKRVVGVILTGLFDDGTAGLFAVKEAGGVAVVQEPADALYDGMPRSAIENVAVDAVLPVAELAPLLVRLTGVPVAGEGPVMPRPTEPDVAELELGAQSEEMRLGAPAVYACPECHGTLWEVTNDNLVHFRCRVGHAYSIESLLAEQATTLESALWTAYRALRESAALARRMSKRAHQRGMALNAARYDGKAAEDEQRAALVLNALRQGDTRVPSSAQENESSESSVPNSSLATEERPTRS